jgi:hypothetical protein
MKQFVKGRKKNNGIIAYPPPIRMSFGYRAAVTRQFVPSCFLFLFPDFYPVEEQKRGVTPSASDLSRLSLCGSDGGIHPTAGMRVGRKKGVGVGHGTSSETPRRVLIRSHCVCVALRWRRQLKDTQRWWALYLSLVAKNIIGCICCFEGGIRVGNYSPWIRLGR